MALGRQNLDDVPNVLPINRARDKNHGFLRCRQQLAVARLH